jgi:hypothetical protein
MKSSRCCKQLLCSLCTLFLFLLLLFNGVSSFTRTTTTTTFPAQVSPTLRRQLLTTTRTTITAPTTRVHLLPPHFLTSILHYYNINAMTKKKTKTSPVNKRHVSSIHPNAQHLQQQQQQQSTFVTNFSKTTTSHHKKNIESSSSSLLLLSSLSSSATFTAASPAFVLPTSTRTLSNTHLQYDVAKKMAIVSFLKLMMFVSMSRQRLSAVALLAWTRVQTSSSRNFDFLSVLIRRHSHVITKVSLLISIISLIGYASSALS